jgi:ligand-binding sensor domain-containing protein
LKFTSGIRAILQDSKGNYWFGSHQEGICKYDGSSFTYFTTKDGLPGNQIIALNEDSYGNICISTNNGLCTIVDSIIKLIIPITSSNYPITNVKVSRNDIWASYGTDYIKTEKNRTILLENPFIQLNVKNPKDYGITCFTNGKNDNVWIGTYSGVIGYNGKFHTKISDSTLGYDGKDEYMHVRSILEDSKGRLWIGNNGIGILLKQGDSIVNFSKKHQLYKGTPFTNPALYGTLMHVFSISEDKNGNIWFGDRDTGAWMYDGKTMTNLVVDSLLKSQHVWSIYNDKNGNLLFGMAEKGVYRYSENKFERVF